MDKAQAHKLINDERQRQISVEGWTESHDDQHDYGEMAKAALAYYLSATGRCSLRADGAPLGWPWDVKWWKPKEPMRDLVRSGALFVAEKERLRRLPGSGSLKRDRAARMDPKIQMVVNVLVGFPHPPHERQPISPDAAVPSQRRPE